MAAAARIAGNPPPGPLHEVTPRLRRGLAGWLQHVLIGAAAGSVARPRSQYDGEVGELMLRLDIDVPPWNLPGDQILDAVDATLPWHDWSGWSGRSPADLDAILAAGSSVWRWPTAAPASNVAWTRPSPRHTGRLFAPAAASPGQYLAHSLGQRVRPQPRSGKAYDQAVLAVEELLAPQVLTHRPHPHPGQSQRKAQNPRSRMATQLRRRHRRTRRSRPTAGHVLTALAGPVPHAGSANTRAQTQTEAETAVYAAVTLVQWLWAGLLQRRP